MKNLLDVYNKYGDILLETVGHQTDEVSKDSLVQNSSSFMDIQVGDICFYNDEIIGVVVLVEPLTIMEVTSVYYDEFAKGNKRFLPLASNSSSANKIKYHTGYMSYYESLMCAKHYKTPGTNLKSWHIPTVEELEKIGFRNFCGKDLYDETAKFGPNKITDEWLDKVSETLYELPASCEFNPNGCNNFWCQQQEEGKNTAPCFSLDRIYTNRPGSNGIISELWLEIYTGETHAGVRLFHTVTPYERKKKFRFKSLEIYKIMNEKVEIDGSKHIKTDVNEHELLNLFGKHKNQEYVFENINEGLIVSYDIDKCKKYLKKIFPNIVDIRSLEMNPFQIRKKRITENDFVSIILNSEFDNYLQIIKKIESLIGWFVSSIKIMTKTGRPYVFMKFKSDEQDDTDEPFVFICESVNKELELNSFLNEKSDLIDTFEMFIESKFFKRYYQKPDEKFYHVSNKFLKKKILNKGLIPKTSGLHPERIYLGTNIETILDMIGGKAGSENCIFEIDTDGLELYIDPRSDDSYFTYDNISPEKIKLINERG